MAESNRQAVDPLQIIDHQDERFVERGSCPMGCLEHTQWIKRLGALRTEKELGQPSTFDSSFAERPQKSGQRSKRHGSLGFVAGRAKNSNRVASRCSLGQQPRLPAARVPTNERGYRFVASARINALDKHFELLSPPDKSAWHPRSLLLGHGANEGVPR
jgi:hypothetical protein